MPRYTQDTSPWLKRVLIPFWVLRIILMVLITISFAVGIAVIAVDAHNNDDDTDDDGDADGNSRAESPGGNTGKLRVKDIVVIVVFFVLVLICLALDIISVVKHARHNLRPKTFLIFNAVQTVFWAAILVIDVVSAVRTRSALSFLFALVVFFLFLGLFIYAIVVYRRARRDAARGLYAPAAATANPAAAGAAPVVVGMQPAAPPVVAPSPAPGGNATRLSTTYCADAAALTNSLGGLSRERTPVGSPFASQGPYAMDGREEEGERVQPAGQGYEEAIEMGRR